MVVFKDKIELNSSTRIEIIDITSEVQLAIDSSKITDGVVNVFSKHSTSSIVVNENEVGLLSDFENILNKLIPEKNNYNHDRIDNNSDSHLKSFFLGPSENIPIINKKLALGTWQSVFFIEFDGPRNRSIGIAIVG